MATTGHDSLVWSDCVVWSEPKSAAQWDSVFSTTSKGSLWTDEQWKKSIENLRYVKKQEVPNEEEVPSSNEGDANKDSLYDKFQRLFAKGWFQFVIIIALGALLLVLLLRFFGKGLGVRNAKLDKSLMMMMSQLESDVRSSNPDDLLLPLEEQGQYKNAIRVLFLKVLKELDERRLIVWTVEKTNAHYLREMQGTEHYSQLRRLVEIYELVWYGDAEVKATAYSRLKTGFVSFIQNLKQV